MTYSDYYPADSAPAEFGFRPCKKCGANVNVQYLSLHIEWHEQAPNA